MVQYTVFPSFIAFPSYGHCPNLHCPDKGGLTVDICREEKGDLNLCSLWGYVTVMDIH